MEGIVPATGGGTQYTDGQVSPANPVGTIPVFDDGGVITAVSDVNPLPVSASFTPSGTQNVDVVGNTIGLATSANQSTGNTSLGTIAGAVSGTEMQVDIITIPTVTVQATNLDIRDLTFAGDKVDASGTVLGAGTNNIGDVDVLTLPSIPAGNNNIGDVDIATMPNVVIGSGTVTAVTSITNTVVTKEVRSATPSQTSPSVTNASTSILASNANRLGATIYNEGAAICYTKLGATASVTSYTLQIAVGGYYELPFAYTGAVDGITSAGTAQLRVTELTS